MRRDKVVTRIFFILSVVHVAVAAPAVVSRRFLDGAEDFTRALEKRIKLDGEWSLVSYSLPHPGSEVSMGPDPASDSPPDSGTSPTMMIHCQCWQSCQPTMNQHQNRLTRRRTMIRSQILEPRQFTMVRCQCQLLRQLTVVHRQCWPPTNASWFTARVGHPTNAP